PAGASQRPPGRRGRRRTLHRRASRRMITFGEPLVALFDGSAVRNIQVGAPCYPTSRRYAAIDHGGAPAGA
ncbi:hypothetical protein, partial [Burkholderia pseudomallei]|nr:hypothetical protein [Burkholderia pseudomallei]